VPAFTLLLINYIISYFDNEWRFCWMENRSRNKMQNGSWLIRWINSCPDEKVVVELQKKEAR